MNSQNDIHTRLKDIRIQKGYTQEEIAGKLNVSRQAVSRWETRKALPDIDNLKMLGELYGMSVDEILGKEISCYTEAEENPQEDRFRLRDACLIVVLVLTLYQPVLGLIVSLGVLAWMIIKKQYSKILMIVTVVSILENIHTLYNLYHIYF